VIPASETTLYPRWLEVRVAPFAGGGGNQCYCTAGLRQQHCIIGAYHVFMALSRMGFLPSFVLKRNKLRGSPHYFYRPGYWHPHRRTACW